MGPNGVGIRSCVLMYYRDKECIELHPAEETLDFNSNMIIKLQCTCVQRAYTIQFVCLFVCLSVLLKVEVRCQ